MSRFDQWLESIREGVHHVWSIGEVKRQIRNNHTDGHLTEDEYQELLGELQLAEQFEIDGLEAVYS